jgi:hypothetical protein
VPVARPAALLVPLVSAELAAAGGVGLEINPAVEGHVTLRLIQVRWDHAFAIVARVNGLEWTRDGATLKVFPARRH